MNPEGKRVHRLKDEEIIDIYFKGKELKCSPEFILIILNELKKRNLYKRTEHRRSKEGIINFS
jgi:hypothetical protein